MPFTKFRNLDVATIGFSLRVCMSRKQGGPPWAVCTRVHTLLPELLGVDCELMPPSLPTSGIVHCSQFSTMIKIRKVNVGTGTITCNTILCGPTRVLPGVLTQPLRAHSWSRIGLGSHVSLSSLLFPFSVKLVRL